MDVESEINQIKQRNVRVEADKAWETSFERRTMISLGTYVFTAIFLLLINAPNPFLAALVPVLGFLLSTLTLPFLKDQWLKSRSEK